MPKNEIKRVFNFGLVGLSTAIVHLIVAQLTLHFIEITFLSSFVGFIVAFPFSYYGQRNLTFADANRRSVKRFIIVAFSAFGFSSFVLWHLDDFYPSLALTISICVIPAWTYAMSRLWVFGFENKSQNQNH